MDALKIYGLMFGCFIVICVWYHLATKLEERNERKNALERRRMELERSNEMIGTRPENRRRLEDFLKRHKAKTLDEFLSLRSDKQ
jgi:hypothetical protein